MIDPRQSRRQPPRMLVFKSVSPRLVRMYFILWNGQASTPCCMSRCSADWYWYKLHKHNTDLVFLAVMQNSIFWLLLQQWASKHWLDVSYIYRTDKEVGITFISIILKCTCLGCTDLSYQCWYWLISICQQTRWHWPTQVAGNLLCLIVCLLSYTWLQL